MSKATRWCVVVGKPCMEKWKLRATEPSMDNVGRVYGGGKAPYIFNTRKAARVTAKQAHSDNPYWQFHAKKV